jgi:hypothetical protein
VPKRAEEAAGEEGGVSWPEAEALDRGERKPSRNIDRRLLRCGLPAARTVPVPPVEPFSEEPPPPSADEDDDEEEKMSSSNENRFVERERDGDSGAGEPGGEARADSFSICSR